MAKKTGVLKEEFRSGAHRELLRDIYLDENVLDYQTERYIKALESYEELYGEQEVEIYSAPGRSEVGGNHTDHQRGHVLAAKAVWQTCGGHDPWLGPQTGRKVGQVCPEIYHIWRKKCRSLCG